MLVRSFELWRMLSASRNDSVRRFSRLGLRVRAAQLQRRDDEQGGDEHAEDAEQDRQQPPQRQP